MNRIFHFLKHTLCAFLILTSVVCVGQNTDKQNLDLARQYYNLGDFEKAIPIFYDLFHKNANNGFYYSNLFKCYLSIQDFESAQKLVKKQKKKHKNNLAYEIDEAYIKEVQGNLEEADNLYQKVILKTGIDINKIRGTANAFNSINKESLAIQTYEMAKNKVADPYMFARDLAYAYKKKGDFNLMIDNFLDYILISPKYLQSAKNEFQKVMVFVKYNEHLQSQLYQFIQRYPERPEFVELLTWVFMQNKDYSSALIQVKALDRRYNESGKRLHDLAKSALTDQNYETAIGCYQYIIDEKGPSSPFYKTSKVNKIDAQMQLLTKAGNVAQEELKELESEFLVLLNIIGKNPVTVPAMRKLSQLYAHYLLDVDAAIALLEEVIDMRGVQPKNLANTKLDLGDYYILKDDVWEATLYYSQVDKDFKDDPLGEEARYRNAMLSYYIGDFEWAQTQFDILKAATSELISNNAIEQSVFIIDNLGLDTTEVTMQTYSQADLAIFQQDWTKALMLLESIERDYPGHSLADDILFRKAEIAEKQNDNDAAKQYYQSVYESFGSDLLADNALFKLAEMAEQNDQNMEEAMTLYQDILLTYPNSLLTVEARKRFRRLRGDLLAQ